MVAGTSVRRSRDPAFSDGRKARRCGGAKRGPGTDVLDETDDVEDDISRVGTFVLAQRQVANVAVPDLY